MKDYVYLDNNATTRTDPAVVEAMMPFLTERYGNPSSMHAFGGEVEKDISNAREQIAALIGAAELYEIVFTGTGTEADNIAVFGAAGFAKDKRHIITTVVEHPAVLNPCRELARAGYRVTWLPVASDGKLDTSAFYKAIDDDTAIVSVMYANNETGVIFPVEEIGAVCKERNVLFHVDAVQAAGKIPIEVNKINCDLLTVAGHKFHGPKGIGVLYVRKGTPLNPIVYGGHQERSRRPGTENVAGIVGMGKAAELAVNHLKGGGAAEIKRLRDKLEAGILARFKNAAVNGNQELRVANTSNIGFSYIEGEAILLYLDSLGICASSGSACSSGSLDPSHVLKAMGVPFTSLHGSVRFSLSRYTTEEEIDYALSVMPKAIEPLLALSPYWDDEKQQGIPISINK